jgi:hypothetical protein
MLFIILLTSAPCYSQYFEYRGSTLWTGVTNVIVSGNYAYCVYASGLEILDITDLGQPVMVSKLRVDGLQNVAKYGNYILGMGYSIDLTIIDVSDPLNPEIALVSETGRGGGDICIRDTLAYLATSRGLNIINLAEPLQPQALCIFEDIGGYKTIALSGDYAFLGSYWNVIEVMNISNPSNPAWVSTFEVDSEPREIVITDTIAYVADYARGLLVIDINDPANLRIISNYDPIATVNDVGLWGNYAFITSDWIGIEALDISDPSNPWPSGAYNTHDSPYELTMNGEYAFLANNYSLEILNISNPGEIYTEGLYSNTRRVFSIEKSGDYIAACDGEKLWMIDSSDPENPRTISELGLYYDSKLLGIYQHYVYLRGETGYLTTIDIADPYSPVQIGNMLLPYEFYCMAIWDHYAYLGTSNGIHIVDIAEPTSPNELGLINSGMILDLHAENGFLAGGGYILHIFSLNDPANPLPLSEFGLSDRYIQGIDLQGNFIYLALMEEQVNHPGVFYSINIENPLEPHFGGMFSTSEYMFDVEVAGKLAILSNNNDGLGLQNIADPYNPTDLGIFTTSGSVRKTIIEDSLIYIADGATVSVLRYNPPCIYVTGDLNNSNNFNGLDPVFGVNYFKGGMIPPYTCKCGDHSDFFVTGDVNHSCTFNGLDITYMVRHLKGGPAMEPCEDCLSIHP